MRVFCLLISLLVCTFSYAETVSLRVFTTVTKGPMLPIGCASVSASLGNLGDVLGDELINIQMNNNVGEFSRKIKTSNGDVSYSLVVRRDPEMDYDMSLSAYLKVNNKVERSMTFNFNKRNELEFPYTRLSKFLGVNGPYCETAVFVVTPMSY